MYKVADWPEALKWNRPRRKKHCIFTSDATLRESPKARHGNLPNRRKLLKSTLFRMRGPLTPRSMLELLSWTLLPEPESPDSCLTGLTRDTFEATFARLAAIKQNRLAIFPPLTNRPPQSMDRLFGPARIAWVGFGIGFVLSSNRFEDQEAVPRSPITLCRPPAAFGPSSPA